MHSRFRLVALTVCLGILFSGCANVKPAQNPIGPTAQKAAYHPHLLDRFVPQDFLTGELADIQVWAAPSEHDDELFSVMFGNSALNAGDKAAGLVTLCAGSYVASKLGYSSVEMAGDGLNFAALLILKVRMLSFTETRGARYSIYHPTVVRWCSEIVAPQYMWL